MAAGTTPADADAADTRALTGSLMNDHELLCLRVA